MILILFIVLNIIAMVSEDEKNERSRLVIEKYSTCKYENGELIETLEFENTDVIYVCLKFKNITTEESYPIIIRIEPIEGQINGEWISEYTTNVSDPSLPIPIEYPFNNGSYKISVYYIRVLLCKMEINIINNHK